mgnify:CR=1 FL=1
MSKEVPRAKNQDPHEFPRREPVVREDGLPTLEDFEKLLGKPGMITDGEKVDHKKHEGCGVMMVEETISMSPLDKVVNARKPAVDLDKVDSRHDDIIKLVESILKLSR